MRFADIKPRIRFADRLEYTAARPLSRTYDSRLLYVVSGAGEITVGGTNHKIEPGLLIIFQCGVAYRFSPSPSFVAYAVDFDAVEGFSTDGGFLPPALESGFDPSAIHGWVEFEDSDFLKTPFVCKVPHAVGEELRAIAQEYTAGARHSKERAQMMLYCTLLDLERRFFVLSKAERTASAVLDYISEHYLEDLSNEGIARVFGHDPCYLGRVVKLYTGSPIHRLLIKKRVDVGVKLLLTTDMTLDEIAERTGFCSAAHFSRRCRALTGNPPSYYRKSAGAKNQ
jgi:AraC-like DNA-binding protein